MESEANSLLRELVSASINYRDAVFWRKQNNLRGKKGEERRKELEEEIAKAKLRLHVAENRALDYIRGFKINY